MEAHTSTQRGEMGVVVKALGRGFSVVREERILVREPDLPNRPHNSCLNLTKYPRPYFQERQMNRM